MKQKLLFLLLFSVVHFSSAQNDFLLKGKIVSQSESLDNVTIFNKTKKVGSFSDEKGNFSIKVSVGDSLHFSAIHLKYYEHLITKEDSIKMILYIPMETNVKELNELTLTEYKSITPEALGIIPYGMKKFTPAERRLAQATGSTNQYGLNTQVSFDALLNAISGRTKMLKRALKTEKKELFIEGFRLDYNKEYIKDNLKIPEEYVEAFYFYLAELPIFKSIYEGYDKIKCEFELSKIAVEYLEILHSNQEKTDE